MAEKQNQNPSGPPSGATGAGPARGPAETTFSIVVNINGKDLEFSIPDIKKAKDDGFEFSQDTPLRLGTVASFEDFLSEHLIDIPGPDALPAPLDSIYEKARTADISLHRLHFKMQPKASVAGNLYTIKFKIGWDPKPVLGADGKPDPDKAPPTIGPLKLSGFIFGVRNEPEKKAEPSSKSDDGKKADDSKK
jgi:hypothetical protein